MLTVTVLDTAKLPVIHNYTLAVISHDAYAVGGPHTATIEATGDALDALRGWLGYYVIIRNENNTPVWWGKVVSATTPIEALEVGASLQDMANCVKVAYTVGGVAYETAWNENAKSIDAYGRKELLFSVGEASAAQAAAAALTLLKDRALAKQSINFSAGGAAILSCAGLWSLYDWTYYADSTGRTAYEGMDSAEQIIGWGVAGTDIGFADRAIHKLNGNLGQLNEGDKIMVTGSIVNNGILTAAGSALDGGTYTASTVSFAAGDDILDSAEGLGIARMGSFLRVTGSASNSRAHLIDGVGRAQITTAAGRTGAIITEAAGPSITLRQAASLDVTNDLTIEAPGAAVTLTGVQKMAFSFAASSNFVAGEIAIKIRSIGAAGGSVRVSLCANSSSVPGIVLESSVLSGIGNTSGWVSFPLSATIALIGGATYWVIVERIGATSTENYYGVGYDGDNTINSFLLWNGVFWESKPGTVVHQVWGHQQTTTQLATILATKGQFLYGAAVRPASGVMARHYRSGNQTALTELETLLDSGTATGATLLATVTPDWRVIVDVAPDSTLPPFLLRSDGRVATAQGSIVEEGLLPVGQWCAVDVQSAAGALAPLSPFLVGYAEYNVRQGRISDIKRYGEDSVWDIPTLLQG